MEYKISGKSKSLWVDTTPTTNFPKLKEGLNVDVVVLGGGIAGITTAIMLKKAGKKVAVIESGRIIKDITSTTTAKISAHIFFYNMYMQTIGKEKTNDYAITNLKAVETISNLVSEYEIDCDFRRVPCYLYTESEQEIDVFKAEAELASEIGLPAEYTADIPVSSKAKAGLVYQNQAEFHPRKYLLALSKEIDKEGSYVFENTRALDITEGSPYTIITDQGPIKADKVVVATHLPIYDPDRLYTQMKINRSYTMAFYAKEAFPIGMFVCINPFHTYRSTPTPKGELIIIAGEHQAVGDASDTMKCYKNLEKYSAENWDIESIEYHWVNQDNTTPDGIPAIGETSKPGIYVATGFGGWGMTHGTTTGLLLADLIIGKENSIAELFDPLRFKNNEPVVQDIDEKLEIRDKFEENKVSWPDNLKIPKLSDNESVLLSHGEEKFSAYKDKNGNIHRLQAICTHRGCTLVWNTAEKTWDCPCHGSRFNYDGKVIHGPAINDLKNYSKT
ncbi:MAG TPA: FAD-dependent oxidoreductase [Methanobacterium sp.]|nr:FAD-dependent oxidoreductase [Methanobacterium sp.]